MSVASWNGYILVESRLSNDSRPPSPLLIPNPCALGYYTHGILGKYIRLIWQAWRQTFKKGLGCMRIYWTGKEWSITAKFGS